MAVTNYALSDLAQIAGTEGLLKLPILNKFSTTFFSGMAKGDTAKVPIYSFSGATAWNDVSNNYGTDNSTVAFKDVALTGHYKASFEVRDFLSGKLDPAKAVTAGVNKILTDFINTEILSKILAANYAGKTVAATASALDDVLMQTLATTAANWVNPGMLLISSYYANLRKIYQAATTVGTGEMVRSGEVGRLIGMDTAQWSTLPANAENLMGFVCEPSALAVGITTITPQSDTVEYEQFEDPSGLKIGIRKHYDPNLGRQLISVEIVGGAAKGTANLQRIATA